MVLLCLPPSPLLPDYLTYALSHLNPLRLTYFWQHENPLVPCLLVLTIAVLGCWAWSLATNNCSHVDRLWSILPILYTSIFARQELWAVIRLLFGYPVARPPELRLLIQFGLVYVWGIRLTYNFARKGGYDTKFEDYRWAVVRWGTHAWARLPASVLMHA